MGLGPAHHFPEPIDPSKAIDPCAARDHSWPCYTNQSVGTTLSLYWGGLPCTSSAADSAYVLAVLKLGGGNLLKSQEETCKVCINPYERLPHT